MGLGQRVEGQCQGVAECKFMMAPANNNQNTVFTAKCDWQTLVSIIKHGRV